MCVCALSIYLSIYVTVNMINFGHPGKLWLPNFRQYLIIYVLEWVAKVCLVGQS